MESNLRKGWTEIVTADDIDRHLKDIGQAGVNASLVSEMLTAFPPEKHSKFLVAGAGTGQMFDFIFPKVFRGHEMTFTDINSAYLDCLKMRLKNAPEEFQFKTIVDDLEDSDLVGPFDAALIVLVLEHIDWQRGIDGLLRFHPKHLYFIIQRNEPGIKTINTKRDLAPSIQEFSKIASPKEVPLEMLQDYLIQFNYRPIKCIEKTVPDQKAMVGLIVEKAPLTANRDTSRDEP